MLKAVAGQAPLLIEFRRIRWFEGSPLVLWAEPTPNDVLARLHGSISAIIDPVHCRPHYRPGVWTPHCTLGMRIADQRRDGAIAFARSFEALQPVAGRRRQMLRFAERTPVQMTPTWQELLRRHRQGLGHPPSRPAPAIALLVL
ncbi:2'-5' RNA ligase family protein [Bradyrhizobium sp. CB82]|uniref:2'-5' RNA ligase family protein n=1 Tax=Bradyrhizobium sp. CB82 TaxID=3039159 RepID=UPI0024B05724|nr:2'-5' RNA ligase family protein [Bradyrhizobium sp. CB82]WFU42026.1 2'-5' RNA ligase family protein [Bradyrhizobium sp. CB82]